MTVVLQRIGECRVTVDGECVTDVGRGLMLLVGVRNGDTRDDAERLAEKIVKLRIFEDGEGKMNLSVTDIGGDIAVISNFTLLASYRRGNRPDFMNAAPPAEANALYEYFCDYIAKISSLKVGRGVFGAEMKVSLMNDGPVTVVLESDVLKKPKNST